MENKTLTRDGLVAKWQDWVTLLVGAWLFVAPWWLYGGTAPADGGAAPGAAMSWNSWIIGAALAILAVAALLWSQKWLEWLVAALGLWLVVSPWLLGFADLAAAMWNAVICGLIALLLAATQLWELRSMRQKQA